MDEKTNNIAEIVADLRAKLKEIVDQSKDVEAAKVAITSAVDSLDRDLAQLDAASAEPVPEPPAE